MEFTYKIENYYPAEKRMFVVYTPTDNNMQPYGAWVYIEASDSQENILDNIKKSVPLEKWVEPINSDAESLIGYSSEVLTYERDPSLDVRTMAAADRVRFERNILLSECDWTQLSDSPITIAEKDAWEIYRQDLRDITKQSGFPDSVNWPVAPQ